VEGVSNRGTSQPGRIARVMDHLVFAAPELDDGVRHVESLLGASMQPGGKHQGFGTHNRLLGFGGRSYMEVVSPDPDQPPPDGPRWFGLDALESPRLVTWCVSIRDLRAPDGSVAVHERPVPDLETLVASGRAAGIDLGVTRRGMRARPDGSTLRWAMTDPWADRAGGVIPFFIDWGDSPHPAESLAAASRFVDLRVEHPEPARVETWLRALGLDTPVVGAQAPAVIATLETPNGTVELR
jgi:hypothetical protein